MLNESPSESVVLVDFTLEFKRNVRQLAKKYRGIRSDVQPIIDDLQKAEAPGDQVRRTGEDRVIKVRIRNSDCGKGKSGGYRMIYWVKSSRSVVLITIYSKSEQGDVSADFIRRVINEHVQQEAQEEGAAQGS